MIIMDKIKAVDAVRLKAASTPGGSVSLCGLKEAHDFVNLVIENLNPREDERVADATVYVLFREGNFVSVFASHKAAQQSAEWDGDVMPHYFIQEFNLQFPVKTP